MTNGNKNVKELQEYMVTILLEVVSVMKQK